jgi:aspartyl/asparaginyl-tRNA synthetase
MKKIALLLFLFVFAAMACSGIFSTPIKKIIDNPRDYDGKKVTVSGEVTETFSFFVMKYFVVSDGTGTITVVTKKPLPKKGAKIRLRGEVNEMFSLGDSQTLVIVEDSGKK